MMKSLAVVLAACALGASGSGFAAGAQPAQALRVVVNPGDSSEQSRVVLYTAWKTAIEQALRKHGAGGVQVLLSSDASADLAATRSRTQDVFIAPAHVVGSAVRYGYQPVVALDRQVRAVLVVLKDSAIAGLGEAAGKRLGLPLQDSVVTYLVRGEVNAANTSIKRHFASVYDTRYQDALLPCLHLRRCDVVAVEKGVFDRWVAAGEPVRAIMETRPVPGLSVAIRDDAAPGVDALQLALAESAGFASLLRGENAKAVTPKADDFKYVSTLGYFTPRSLPGATVVDAAAVALLLQSGATYVDTRSQAEYKAGHVPGAKLVPYHEKSAKEVDFDAKNDSFELPRLGADRDASLVFACNGPECWKSYKASQAAIKAGYRKVFWFRGGFPEWRSAGMKHDVLAAQ